ncbi:dsRBD fold-containing protein [Kitasatospora sp. NPDC089913]|uniref:dsRBD fold-containing protein n=1 Tax=Kitasatospora sp. NPDC089913 TaxID=3364080 RepID=UPI002570FE89|nr:dsRBD fold-containing protein [Streptomyces sp. TLI_053]
MIVRADGSAAPPGGPVPATVGEEGGTEPPVRSTKDWQLSLHLVEERDTTRVHAVLDADGAVLHSDAYARRNPLDDPAPAVGDEFAVGRALIDLGHQLLRAGTRHATGPAEE